jgi:ribosomal protein L37E
MPRKRNPELFVSCAHCGITFYSTAQRLKKAGQGHQFCSVLCFKAYRKGHSDEFPKPPPKQPDPNKNIHCTCARCGIQFERKSYNLARKYGPFCSGTCYGKWRSENLIGENSPNWKGGIAYERGSSFWKAQRLKARDRDAFICQDCGVTESARAHPVHHIVSVDQFDSMEEAHALSNLKTVCSKCHAVYHEPTGAQLQALAIGRIKRLAEA